MLDKLIDKDKQKYFIAYFLTVCSPLIMSWAGGSLMKKAGNMTGSMDFVLGVIMLCMAGTFGTALGYYFARVYKYPSIAGFGRLAILGLMVGFAMLTKDMGKPGAFHGIFFGVTILAIVLWNLADILFLYPNIKKKEEEERLEADERAKAK